MEQQLQYKCDADLLNLSSLSLKGTSFSSFQKISTASDISSASKTLIDKAITETAFLSHRIRILPFKVRLLKFSENIVKVAKT
jgi:hypothetical protein